MMPSKADILAALGDVRVKPELLVDEQTTEDIIQGIRYAHERDRQDYDKIAGFFEAANWDDTAEMLWDFCKQNIRYKEESNLRQQVSHPATILRRGYCDCKGYALFIGGVLDALNRASGYSKSYCCNWVYRFSPSSMIETSIGHVFVVIDPDSMDSVWVDPVADGFDLHFIYLVKQDEKMPRTQTVQVGSIGAMRQLMHMAAIGTTSAEQNLLDQLNEYVQGLISAVRLTQTTNTFNTITAGVGNAIAAAIPGGAAVLSFLKQGSAVLNNAFGVGSVAARIVSDYVSNPLLAPVSVLQDLLRGRTFESDNYEGARYYFYYVKGNASYISGSNVSDADVYTGLKWFIDKLGVFISGREHIIALTQSAQAYMAFYGVNHYTTMDLDAVNRAVAVAQEYFNFNSPPGAWASTVGVFDPLLIQVAQQTGQSVEQVAAETSSGALTIPGYNDAVTTTVKNLFSSPVAWIAVAVVVGIIITSD